MGFPDEYKEDRPGSKIEEVKRAIAKTNDRTLARCRA